MTATIIELLPNRQFIDPEFNGYKLSLETIPILQKELSIPVDKITPDPNQYSFLHARLIGLHNHLVGETIDGTNILYFVDQSCFIKKITMDNELQVMDVLNIPKYRDRNNCDYNICLKMVNKSLAIFSDGMGKLYVLKTSNRKENHHWNCIFSESVLHNNQPFVVQDVRYKESNEGNQIHCLLYNIQQRENDRFIGFLYWVILHEINNNWKIFDLQEITGSANSVIYYAYLESSCQAVYIISDGCYQFSQNLVEQDIPSSNINKKKYCWGQTEDDITIKFRLLANTNMDSICIDSDETRISISINNNCILSGTLCHRIDNSLTNWSVDREIIEVQLFKQTQGQNWLSLVPEDHSGVYITDFSQAEEIHEKLSHLYSDNKVSTPLGTTLSTQQVEECDFEDDKYTTFERLSNITYDVTHRVNISTHSLVLTVDKSIHYPPALGLRHDVDTYIWQPIFENGDFYIAHEGTLNAFGYVQASKQQRKFSVCAPDLSYCAVCDTSRHLFIYRQQKTINGGELRHRATGKRIGNVAQQQVVNLPDNEILGIYPAETELFLLTAESIYVLKL